MQGTRYADDRDHDSKQTDIYPIGISVSNTPGAVNDATATTAFYLIFATVRQFPLGERSLRAGTWKTTTIAPSVHDLTGRTLGILVLSGTGSRLGELAHAFPMRILNHSRHQAPTAPAWCEYVPNLEDMLAQTDVLSIHLPLNTKTEGFVGEQLIRALKKGAIIINAARGKITDEEALIRTLDDGHVRCKISVFSSD
jgi:glyoxylate reductase